MKKLHLVSILLFVFSIIACKKEEVNNPDIDDVAINFSVESTDPAVAASKDLFIDGEVLQDFQFVISHPDDDPNQHSIDVRVYDSKYELLTHMEDDADVISVIDRGSAIKPSDTYWKGSFILLYHHIITSMGTIYHYGTTDIGDQYIAMRKKNSSGGYFYGWIKINISNNGQKLEVKEYALHKIADTPIKAGEK